MNLNLKTKPQRIASLRGITGTTLEKINRAQGYKWLGEWQREAAQFIGNNQSIIIQGPRQAMGKTHLGALAGAAYLLNGGSVIQAMPTIQQGKSLLFRRTAAMVEAIKKEMSHGTMAVISDTTTEKSYTNGAKFQLLSVEQMKDESHPPEGYTGDLLIIDEGHRATEDILGICLPFLFHARHSGTAKVLILGVGGHKMSLIERMKGKGYSAMRVTPDRIVEADPTYAPVFDAFKQELTDIEYRQHILCESIDEGLRRMFSEVIKARPFTPQELSETREVLYFGIDVGRSSDRTCIAVLRRRGGYIDLLGTFYTTGPFTTRDGQGQDRRIHAYIDGYSYEPGNMAIEINGLGCGLWDCLRKDFFYQMQGVPLTYNLKNMWIKQLTNDIRDGIFRCVEQRDIDELESLRFEMKMPAKGEPYFEWEHSDLLSAILMAYASMQRVLSYA